MEIAFRLSIMIDVCNLLKQTHHMVLVLIDDFYFQKKENSDTGNRTPNCSVKANRASRYTISDSDKGIRI